MQVRATSVPEGETLIEVIDPSDGAVTHKAVICEGERITISTSAKSPAEVDFGEVEAIPEPEAEAEAAEAGEAEDDIPGMDDPPKTAAEDDSAVDDADPEDEAA